MMTAKYPVMWLLCLSLVLLFAGSQGYYEGYKRMVLSLKTKEQLIYLQELERKHPEMDVWSDAGIRRKGMVVLPPETAASVERDMKRHGISITYGKTDLDTLIRNGDDRRNGRHPRRHNNHKIDHTRYHSYTQIKQYLRKLSRRFPKLVTTLYARHRTFEGRRVYLLKISTGRNYRNGYRIKRPTIIVEAGQHAREWIAPAANLYFIEQMLTRYYKGDHTARLMVDKYDWYVIPLVNPDGYEYSRLRPETRLWRKNRRPIPGTNCIGVDPNRNYDGSEYFGVIEPNRQLNCSSSEFRGEFPFSDAETKNTRDLFLDNKDSVVAFVSVHTFGNQFFTAPIALSDSFIREKIHFYRELPNILRDKDEIIRVAKRMKDRVFQETGVQFYAGSIADFYGAPFHQATNGSSDWAFQEKHGVYSITVELTSETAGDDSNGFLSPPSQIVPAGETLYQGMYAMAANMDSEVIRRLINHKHRGRK